MFEYTSSLSFREMNSGLSCWSSSSYTASLSSISTLISNFWWLLQDTRSWSEVLFLLFSSKYDQDLWWLLPIDTYPKTSCIRDRALWIIWFLQWSQLIFWWFRHSYCLFWLLRWACRPVVWCFSKTSRFCSHLALSRLFIFKTAMRNIDWFLIFYDWSPKLDYQNAGSKSV